MRNSYITTMILLCLLSWQAKAQSLPPLQPEQDACHALDLCGGIFSTPYSYTGYGTIQEQAQFAPSSACVDETNSVWLRVQVATPGLIAFTITPVNTTNDYDFAVYNITNSNCNTITPANRVRCNGCDINSSPGGVTGLSITGVGVVSGTGPGPNFISAINAAAGDVYLIMIDNFNTGAAVSGFSIDFSASTATFVQPPAPKMLGLAPSCYYGTQVKVQLSKPVKCASIAANGSDFSLSPSGSIASATGTNCTPNGYTSEITLTFAGALPSGNYVLNAQQGTDNNTLLDICNTPLALPDTLHFYVASNSLQIVKLDTPACIKARIYTNDKIKCSTVAANGSDFVVTGPSPVTVVKAVPVGCSNGVTDTIDIYFNKSIVTPGTYTLAVVVGTDNNAVNDTCGRNISNTFSWYVNDHGYVEAIASPNLLCEKGYVQLDALSSIVLPTVNTCGPASSIPPGLTVVAQLGTGTPATGAVYPFTSYWHDGRTQLLFTGAELAAQGLKKGAIVSLTLDVSGKNSTAPFNGFTIKMGCTSLTALPTNFAPAPTTIVYTPKAYSTVQGINTFVFDVPYNWDSVSNLIVELCYDNSGYTQYDYVNYTTTTFNSAVYYYADNSVGCNFTSSYAALSNRPNVGFSQVVPPPVVKKWYPGTFVGDTTAFSTLAYVPATTMYTFETMDSNFCYRRDTANVIVSVRNPRILLPTKDTAICAGDTLQLLASGGVTYQWSPVDYLSCTNCENPVSRPAATVTYTVTVGDQYGCTDDLTRKIVVHPLPVVNAGKDTTILYGTSLELKVSAPGGMYYLWNPITYLNNPNIANPIVTPEVTTRYTVRVVDTNRCENMDTILVKVSTDIPVTIPNAFSPNGDGMNDVFRPGNMIFQKLVEFRVFNRWGREIFSSADPKKGWDGTYNGQPQEIGVYNYLIRVAWPGGRVETFKGDVTLFR